MHNNIPITNKQYSHTSTHVKNQEKSFATHKTNKRLNDNDNDKPVKTMKETKNEPPQKRITLGTIILTCCIITHSFYIGYNLSPNLKHSLLKQKESRNIEYTTKHHIQDNSNSHLPIPTLHPSKQLPEFKYTYKHYDINGEDEVIVRSSHTLLIEDNNETVSMEHNDEPNAEPNDESHEEVYEPAGQHLLLDIKNVNPTFLNSEEQLSQAIIQIITRSQLTLLSYHCHGLYPTGVSCVGVLLESHISLHTWPEDGVILLDLFTCGSDSLLPLVDDLLVSFGPSVDGCESEECRARMVWSHKLRGFRSGRNLYSRDIGKYVLENMLLDYKQEVLSKHTKSIQIDVYDTISPKQNSISSYESSLNTNHTYHSNNPQFYQPNRYMFLNGFLHKNSLGSKVMDEAFVHFGMFLIEAKNAWIVGGDGGVLNEVLKHDVEVVMNDYLDVRNIMDLSYDNSKVQIVEEDPIQTKSEQQFDAVILDIPLLSLNHDIETMHRFINQTYDENTNGVLIMKMGLLKKDEILVNDYSIPTLQDFKFDHCYLESHVQFTSPMVFCVRCKDCHWKSSVRKRMLLLDFEYFDEVVFDSYRNQKF